MLGFLSFRIILKHDDNKRFGKSIVVWIALLSLVLFVSLVWMSRSIMDATDKGIGYVEDYYTVSGISDEVSGGISDYEPGVSDSFKSVFEKADALMYEEKKLLKSMGATTRS